MLWNDKRPGGGLTEHTTAQPHGWDSVPKSPPTRLEQNLSSDISARGKARDAARNSRGAVHAADYSKWSAHSEPRSHLR